jgi:hypothetical protein
MTIGQTIKLQHFTAMGLQSQIFSWRLKNFRSKTLLIAKKIEKEQ